MRRAQARAAMDMANAYQGASRNRLFADWLGGNESATPTATDLETLRNRSRDANRNFALARGATDTMSFNVVGQGLRPEPLLSAARMGISEDYAEALRDQIGAAWDLWTPYADSANILTFDEIQFLAITKVIEDGETFGLPTWADDPWRMYGRALEVVEADRIQTPTDKARLGDLAHGIEYGKKRGEPLAYWIAREQDKTGTYRLRSDKFVRVPARDGAGRPKVLHAFPTRRPSQMRGVPFFAPILGLFKHLTQYLEAEVVIARIAACLGVFVVQNDPYTGAVGNTNSRQSSTNARIQRLSPGLVGYLNRGEDIKTVEPTRPGDNYDDFVTSIIRQIGVALGLPYEILLKDFSKTNYSSARAAILEARRAFTFWRGWFASKFCQPIYELVLEEAYLRDMIDAPDWNRWRHEICRARWIGGAWGWVDPVKEVESSNKAVHYNLSTLAEEAAAQGRNWKDVIKQRKREKEYAEEAGVPAVAPSGGSQETAAELEDENGDSRETRMNAREGDS